MYAVAFLLLLKEKSINKLIEEVTPARDKLLNELLISYYMYCSHNVHVSAD